jgi:hypothetical protein
MGSVMSGIEYGTMELRIRWVYDFKSLSFDSFDELVIDIPAEDQWPKLDKTNLNTIRSVLGKLTVPMAVGISLRWEAQWFVPNSWWRII